MDDIILASNDMQSIHDMILDQQFKIKDLDNLKFFLGLEVARSQQDISLCLRKFALDIHSDTSFLGAQPAKTPGE